MRITREYVFDMIEMIGKAVATARKRQASDYWLIDNLMDFFVRRYDIAEPMVDEEAQKEDYGLLEGTEWQGQNEARNRETRLDLDRNGWSKYGADAYEMKRAQKFKDEFGDCVAWQLRTISRKLAFKDIGAVEALKELQKLCDGLRKHFISDGWANRLAAIIDSCAGWR